MIHICVEMHDKVPSYSVAINPLSLHSSASCILIGLSRSFYQDNKIWKYQRSIKHNQDLQIYITELMPPKSTAGKGWNICPFCICMYYYKCWGDAGIDYDRSCLCNIHGIMRQFNMVYVHILLIHIMITYKSWYRVNALYIYQKI